MDRNTYMGAAAYMRLGSDPLRRLGAVFRVGTCPVVCVPARSTRSQSGGYASVSSSSAATAASLPSRTVA
ncbi:hypothetical protein BN903_22 [Halorubrum sp. AJ67]|nr:hypothetical protein BN903_22 [Halorubrum sp. AJ67]